MPRNEMKDVIVLLPGITGSVLQRDGKDVWAVSPGGVFNFIKSLGRNLESLRLDGDDPDQEDAADGVVATRLMQDVHLIPGLWSIDGYSKIRNSILERFQVQEGKNYIEFPYDWRRANIASARKLKARAETVLSSWRQESGNNDAKLILIAHSMGGIVSRCFLEILDGWELTRSLITFGTPYRGSVNAVDSLYRGMKKKLGPFKVVDLTAALRSFQSIYELLPIYRCVDVGGPDLVRISEADNVPHVDQERARLALAFHHRIRDAVAEHQEDPSYALHGYRIHPITGIEQPTSQSVRLRGDELELLKTWKGKDFSGDGTVPRISALPLEVVDAQAGFFAGEKHGSLQNDNSVLTHLRGLLTGQVIDLSMFEGFVPLKIGVEVDEMFEVSEPISVVATCDTDGLTLMAQLVNVDTAEVVADVSLADQQDGRHKAEVPPQAEGSYRLIVSGGGIDSVTSLLTVIA